MMTMLRDEVADDVVKYDIFLNNKLVKCYNSIMVTRAADTVHKVNMLIF